jgi:hypothetical protein
VDPDQPTIISFMEKIAKFANFGDEKLVIAQMFCDFMILDSEILKHHPSVLAATSVYATNILMKK